LAPQNDGLNPPMRNSNVGLTAPKHILLASNSRIIVVLINSCGIHRSRTLHVI